jgi:translation initiation factor IF-1
LTEEIIKLATEKRARLEMEGVVTDATKGKFRVKISEDYFVLATLSGRIRMNSVRILVGDVVMVEIGEFDTTQGRIIYRKKDG